jgi:hypothetical protein
MQRLNPGCTTLEHAEEVPLHFWLALIAVVAAVLMLILATVSFEGFDRLLRDGEPFAPYYAT